MSEAKIGDIAELKTGPFGTQLHSNEYVKSGIPIINVKNIGYGELICNDLDYVSELTANRLKEHRLLEGDIVFGRKGSIDRHAYISKECSGWLQGSDCIRVRCLDKKKINPKFLSHFFNLDYVKRQLNAGAVGSTMASMNTDILKRVKVLLPDIEVQNTIERVLSTINDKIANNTSICSDLESMAKLIYNYWFVQFDFPDENGRPYKSSGGKMEWNEELKREIPDGWEVGNLYCIADFVNGLACQRFRPIDEKHKLPVIKIGEMHNGFGADVEWARDDISEKHIILDGDILFSWSATLETMIWTKGKGVLNQHIFKVIPKNLNKYYVFQQLSSYIVNFVRMAEARKTTMGHITTDHLNQSRIAIPPKEVAEKYGLSISKAYEKLLLCSAENQNLTSLRDFLLPMLMNGQVKVKS